MVKQQAKIKITPDMVVNLRSDDPYVKEQAEQMICTVCKNFPVPDFSLGKDGVKRESVRIAQCSHCSGLACWNCWKGNCTKKNPTCPRCRFRVDEIPEDLHLDPAKEEKVQQHMNQLKQKLLLNFIFNQTILHKCKLKEKEAFDRATDMYNGQIKTMKK